MTGCECDPTPYATRQWLLGRFYSFLVLSNAELSVRNLPAILFFRWEIPILNFYDEISLQRTVVPLRKGQFPLRLRPSKPSRLYVGIGWDFFTSNSPLFWPEIGHTWILVPSPNSPIYICQGNNPTIASGSVGTRRLWSRLWYSQNSIANRRAWETGQWFYVCNWPPSSFINTLHRKGMYATSYVINIIWLAMVFGR